MLKCMKSTCCTICGVWSVESPVWRAECCTVVVCRISFESARTLSRINLGRKHETGLANCVLLFSFLLSLNEDEGRPILGTPIHYKRQQRSRAGGPGPRKMRAHTTHQPSRGIAATHTGLCAVALRVRVCVCSMRYGTRGAPYKRMWQTRT